jgi:pyruvate formate lyase activating enzyme
MKIGGLQKVSTIDYPGEICSIIFLWGCNFRCGFCYSEEEILAFLDKRRGKIDAVCITGGEPLLSLDLDFVRKIKERGFKVKIDTNGSNPKRLSEMVDLGLVDYVAMDIKGAKEDYSKIVGVDVDLKDIEESMKIVDEVGGEFRTTVVYRFHDVSKMKKVGEWMNEVVGKKPDRIFLQGFRPGESGMIDEGFGDERSVLEKDLVEIKERIEGFFGEVGVRG